MKCDGDHGMDSLRAILDPADLQRFACIWGIQSFMNDRRGGGHVTTFATIKAGAMLHIALRSTHRDACLQLKRCNGLKAMQQKLTELQSYRKLRTGPLGPL